MSDTLDFSRVGREENDLGLDFSGVGSTGVSTQEIPAEYRAIYLDPAFEQLRTAQERLRSAMIDPEPTDIFGTNLRVQYANQVEDLTLELTTKYNVSTQEIGQLLGVYNPDRDSGLELGATEQAIQSAAQTAGQVGGAAFRGAAQLLEPLQIPQQIFFRTLSAQLESAQRGDSFAETMQNIAGSVRDVEYGALLDPRKSAEDFITYGQILEQVGVENRTAVRAFGFLGDVLADPLMAGIYTRGVGILARTAGATRAGEDLIRLGNSVERALSPVGVAEGLRAGTRAAVGANRIAAAEKQMATWLNGFLNQPFFGSETSFGEMFLVRGENPFMRGLSAAEGGAGRPEAFDIFRSRAAQTSDEVLDFVNERTDAIAQVLGRDRTKNVFARAFGALQRRLTGAERVEGMPPRLANAIEAFAGEAADNTSPLIQGSDELFENLDEFVIRDAPEGVASTVGAELREIAGVIPEQSSVIYQRNAERVRAIAEEIGYDPDEAVEAYYFVTDRLMESDVLMGFHQSLYAPMKERFFEEVLNMGGGSKNASSLWEEAIRIGGRTESVDDIYRSAREVLQGTLDEGEELTREYVFRLSSESSPNGEAARILLATDAIRGMEAGTQQLDLFSYFGGLTQGHLRRSYALNPADYDQFLKTLRSGQTASNRIVDETLYTEALEGVVPNEVQDLVRSYIDEISPTIPGEQGFLISATRLGEYLISRGIDVPTAQNALGNIMKAMNPGAMDDLIDNLQLIVQNRAGRLQQVLRRQAGQEPQFSPFSSGKSFTQPRLEVGVDGWDEDAMAELGRLYDSVEVPLRETQIAVARNYTRNKLLDDVYRWSRENNLLFKRDDVTRPRDFVPLIGEQYGAMNGYWVHPALQRQINNATRNAPLTQWRGIAAAGNRIRSMITGAYLTASTPVNIVGGIATAALHGENPVRFANEMINVFRDIRRYGGLDQLPEYNDIADLFRSGVQRSQIQRNLELARLERLQGTRSFGLTEAVDVLADSFETWLRKPAGRFSGLFGLDAFEMSENIMKLAEYRIALQRGEDVSSAYKAARNIVFDYDALPTAFAAFRNTGLMTFPSFTVFATARVFNAALERPGVVASMDRLSQAIWNAQIPNEDIRAALSVSLADYQDEGNAVPVRKRPDENTWSMLNWNNFITLAPWRGNPLADSVLNAGIYQGIVDVLSAFGNQGEARFGQTFGQRVFQASVEGTPAQYRQIAEFLYNNYAPAVARKALTLPAGSDQGASGFIPEIARSISNFVSPAPDGNNGNTLRELNELLSGRPNRDLFESVFTGFVRSLSPVSLEPELNRVLRGRDSAGAQRDQIELELYQQLYQLYMDPSVDPETRAQQTVAIYKRLVDQGLEEAKAIDIVTRGINALQELQGR